MTKFDITITEMLSPWEVLKVVDYYNHITYDFLLNGNLCRMRWNRATPSRIIFKFKKQSDELIFKFLSPNYVDMIKNREKFENKDLTG